MKNINTAIKENNLLDPCEVWMVKSLMCLKTNNMKYTHGATGVTDVAEFKDIIKLVKQMELSNMAVEEWDQVTSLVKGMLYILDTDLTYVDYTILNTIFGGYRQPRRKDTRLFKDIFIKKCVDYGHTVVVIKDDEIHNYTLKKDAVIRLLKNNYFYREYSQNLI